MNRNYPRIIIAGLSGDAGKTLLSLGLLRVWQQAGMSCGAFKKGPDYIDAAWLGWAAQNRVNAEPARNLDLYLMDKDYIIKTFLKHAAEKDINLIEGNRGLFDGLDSEGSCSTAELAKLLSAPILLLVDATKATRTLAALVLGCQKFAPDLRIIGVVLNKIGSSRHHKVACQTIEKYCQIPVLGAIPKLSRRIGADGLPAPYKQQLPQRHLGLVTPQEHPDPQKTIDSLAEIIEKNVDTKQLLDLVYKASPKINYSEVLIASSKKEISFDKKATIGFFSDSAFTFYYPENLEALEAAGAQLKAISPLQDEGLGDIDGLYIGGGFPETHAAILSKNKSMLSAVKLQAKEGLPIYAECGGLVYLAQNCTIIYNSELYSYKREIYPLANVLPISVKLYEKLQGHGYTEALVDEENPYFPVGAVIKGHEFHYSGLDQKNCALKTVLNIKRGFGVYRELPQYCRRDGLLYKNVFASYFHLHVASYPQWAENFIRAALAYQGTKNLCINTLKGNSTAINSACCGIICGSATSNYEDLQL